MRITFILLTLISLTACKDDEIFNLDFSKQIFPENKPLENHVLDSLLTEEGKYAAMLTAEGYTCKTDKEIYKPGEKIMVTIENTGARQMHFSPGEMEAANSHYMFSQVDKEAYKKYLVSQSSGIVNQGATFYDPAFVYVNFSGTDSLTAADLGLSYFDEPMEVGDKITFAVTMPDRAGYYRFIISNYSHDPAISLSGEESRILSNSFQISAN